MKIVNVKKFVKSIITVIGLVFIISLILSNITLSHGETSQKIISVCNGDTLWSIAEYEQENNEYYKDLDIRDIIYQIKKINNIDNNSNLEIGQKLLINSI